MKHRDSFRSLLLEQLESRSLLAGADCVVTTDFGSSTSVGADKPNRDSGAETRRYDTDRSSRVDESRTHSLETKSRYHGSHRSHGSGTSGKTSSSQKTIRVDLFPGDTSNVTSSGSLPEPQIGLEATPRPYSPNTNLSELIGREPISFIVISASYFVSSVLVVQESSPLPSGASSTSSQSEPAAPAHSETSAIDTAADRGPSQGESAQAGLDESKRPQSQRTGVSQQANVLSNLHSIGENDAEGSISLDVSDSLGSEERSVVPLSIAEAERAVEVIDSLPIFQRENPLSGELTPLDPWKLDQASIDELKQISMPRANATNQSDRLTDATIASWFGQGTGFVEFGIASDLPLDVTVRSLASVELDSTMGLHRMVGLLSSGNTNSVDPTAEIRDAILAALVAEPMSSSPAESVDTDSSHSAAVALPGAAMIATGISIAARRRRNAVALSRTTRTNRDETS